MLPDFGWTELLVIAIVLIVVVGPKDLPRVLRGFSNTLGSARKMAADFRKQFDDALSDAEISDLKNIANDVRNLNPGNKIKEAFKPLSDAGRDINKELQNASKSVDDAAQADIEGTDVVNAQVKREYTADEHYPQLAAKRKEREAAEKAGKAEAGKTQTKTKKAAATKGATPKKTAAVKKSTATAAKTTKTKAPAKPATPKKAAPKKASKPKGEA